MAPIACESTLEISLKFTESPMVFWIWAADALPLMDDGQPE